MTADSQISLSLIFSIIACLGVIFSIVNTAYKKHDEEDNKELNDKLYMEKNFVKINTKIDAFCDDVREILKNQEKSNDELRRVSDQLIKDHVKMEDHERRIKALEEKA